MNLSLLEKGQCRAKPVPQVPPGYLLLICGVFPSLEEFRAKAGLAMRSSWLCMRGDQGQEPKTLRQGPRDSHFCSCPYLGCEGVGGSQVSGALTKQLNFSLFLSEFLLSYPPVIGNGRKFPGGFSREAGILLRLLDSPSQLGEAGGLVPPPLFCLSSPLEKTMSQMIYIPMKICG